MFLSYSRLYDMHIYFIFSEWFGHRRASLPGQNVRSHILLACLLDLLLHTVCISEPVQALEEGEGGLESCKRHQLLLHLALHVRLSLCCQGLNRRNITLVSYFLWIWLLHLVSYSSYAWCHSIYETTKYIQ